MSDSPFPEDENVRAFGDTGGYEWHVDGSGHEEPRPLSMLYCVEAPEVGGETLFMSGYQALRNLDEQTRAVAERVAVHYCLPETFGSGPFPSHFLGLPLVLWYSPLCD